MTLPPSFPSTFFWGRSFPSAWISVSTSSFSSSTLFCSSLNLLFSPPLLPIKLDIRNIHQPGCLGVQFAISVRELLGAITQMDLNLSKNDLKASCFHLCRCWSPITRPNKPLNSLRRSQQRNPMLLSFGILIALYFSSFGGDGGVCIFTTLLASPHKIHFY